jgi:hypothetical protein
MAETRAIMRNLTSLAFRIFSGLLVMTFGYTWTVGQSGLDRVNNNLCELWAGTFAKPSSCEFNKYILWLWGLGALVAALFLIFDLARWFRNRRNSRTTASSASKGRPCQIIVGTGAPFETVEPSGVNRTRTVRVKLQNNTDTEISNGKLQLLNLDPANNGYKDFLIKDDITIGPNGRTFISVAAYNEGTSEALVGSWIQLVIPDPGAYLLPHTFGHLPVSSAHTFHLKFSSLDGIYDEVYCGLYVDPGHVLRLEDRGDSTKTSCRTAPANSEMRPKIELIFDANDPQFVLDKHFPYEGNHLKSRMWRIGIKNNSLNKSADEVTIRAKESWFVSMSIAKAHPHLDNPEGKDFIFFKIGTLEPQACEFEDLFGIEPGRLNSAFERSQELIIEARARDAQPAKLVLKYEPTDPPTISKIS